MGNACCADETERRIYDTTSKKVRDLDPSIIQSSSIRFPSAAIPSKANIVSQLNNYFGPFNVKKQISLHTGTPSQPRALNKEGLVYSGQWLNGIPHGKGQLFYPNGSYYIGYFNKGNADKQGRFISPQGWIYQGQLQNQQAQGKGVLYHKGLKYKFQGIWSGDLPNGYGRQQWTSKTITYEGQFLNGKKHGEGKYITSQFTYQGIFNDNKFDSYGVITYRNGQKYEGNFQQGQKHGKGIYTWPDGSYYQGFYKKDLKHGQGKYKDQDGSYWQGQWIEGKRQGLGILKTNNKKFTSQWNNNKVNSNNSNINNNNNNGLMGQRNSKLSLDTFRG